jgi:hypothetical protein
MSGKVWNLSKQGENKMKVALGCGIVIVIWAVVISIVSLIVFLLGNAVLGYFGVAAVPYWVYWCVLAILGLVAGGGSKK